MAQWLIFVIFSAGILWYSWKPLHDPNSHGFYRFFAFEAILGLILLNAPVWLAQPFSLQQIVSWILLLTSLLLAIHGFYLLHQIGKPREGIEDTTQLVVEGAYRYIRHPLYCSLLCMAWGAFLKDPSIPGTCLALVASVFLFATARMEERENLSHFGPEYGEYMKKTKMFVPFVF